MSNKILFTASIAKHIIRFHLPYLAWFKDRGFEIHVACNGEEDIPFCDKKWHIPFVRSPYSSGHIKAYNRLKQLIESEQYKLIHCHTPMASIVTKFAAKKGRKEGTKVLYTAHGFHFFKGASFINWLVYFPAEILTSSLVDSIITINHEDYDRIKKYGSKHASYFIIPGIGVDNKKFYPVGPDIKNMFRAKHGYAEKDFILIYAAEFIARKNHVFLIHAIDKIKNMLPNVKLLFAGRGELLEELKSLAKSKNLLDSHIFFLGFRADIDELYQLADVGVSSSKQEGLGLNLVEEMMCGLPVVAAEDRGHREIVQNGLNGFLYSPSSIEDFNKKILSLYNDSVLYNMCSNNAPKSVSRFELSNSVKVMESIYSLFV